MLLKRSMIFVFLGALVVVISSCWKDAPKKPVEIQKGLVVVNVLEKELFDDLHIKGSIHVPFHKVADIPKIIDKEAEIVFYCSNYMCGASSEARKQAMNMGYKKVYVYEGGMAEWHQKGYPTMGSGAKDYLKIVIPKPDEQQDYILDAEKLKKKLEENKKI